VSAADLVYGFDTKGLLRVLGYDKPRGALWFRCVSLAWLAGYKLTIVDVGRFRLTPRELPPFTFEATITL
jgi:hypothetical protein